MRFFYDRRGSVRGCGSCPRAPGRCDGRGRFVTAGLFESVNPLLFNLVSAAIAVGVGYAIKRFTD
ncbi:hypothetical protein HGG76_00085 [Ochrobactrum tritici]|uniref:Uncharacterized protein n=1 Tax=Brucella tritici TaxID=94626 RepID=A0A7X6FNK1_9HYPH|nr:hypothetical protein [Brucella tritici]